MYEKLTFGTALNNAIPDSILNFLCDGASGDPELEKDFVKTFLDCFALWKKRHRKYGRNNISEFRDAGCLIRDSDKSARLRRFYIENATEDFDDESVKDAWMDKANYSLMGLMCYLGVWPK